MKKLILALLILYSCSKESTTPQNQSSNLSGIWKGNIASQMCSSTTGCMSGIISNYCSITFQQNGNAITITGLIPQVTGSTQLPATLQNNIITIPFNTLKSQNWDFIEGKITVNNNSALITATTQSFDAQHNMTPCCIYYFSGTITKQ